MKENKAKGDSNPDDPLGLALSRKSSEQKRVPAPKVGEEKSPPKQNAANPRAESEAPSKDASESSEVKDSRSEASSVKTEAKESNAKALSAEEEDSNYFISNTYQNENVDYDAYHDDEGKDEERVRRREKTFGSMYQSDRGDDEEEEEEPPEVARAREEKQKFLKSEILENHYLPNEFERFLEGKKKSGGNIGR